MRRVLQNHLGNSSSHVQICLFLCFFSLFKYNRRPRCFPHYMLKSLRVKAGLCLTVQNLRGTDAEGWGDRLWGPKQGQHMKLRTTVTVCGSDLSSHIQRQKVAIPITGARGSVILWSRKSWDQYLWYQAVLSSGGILHLAFHTTLSMFVMECLSHLFSVL